MNILFRNRTDIWVPTYKFNDDSFINWCYFPYFLLLILLAFMCSWLTFYMIIVIREVRKFHENATFLLCSMYGSWFEGLAGSIVIIFYKYGLVDLTDSQQVFEGFESTANYLKIDEITWKSSLLFFATFLVWHYLGVVNSSFAIFFLERTLATVMASDYESVNRPKLRLFLLFLQQTYALFLTIVMYFHLAPLQHLLAANVLGLVIVVPLLLFLRSYNINSRNRMRTARNITKHSLTAKFQTEENVRSIFLASRITVILASFDVIFLTIAILATMKLPGTPYLFQGVEHFLLFGPLFLVPAVVSSEKDWRKRFMVYIPIRKFRIDPNHITVVEAGNQQESTDIYFLQLQTMWQ